jgi:hypothetical protein
MTCKQCGLDFDPDHFYKGKQVYRSVKTGEVKVYITKTNYWPILHVYASKAITI